MLCGSPAFSGASIPEVVFKVVYEQPIALTTQAPTVPAAIAAAVNKAMSKPSGERFSSVNAFIEALTGTPLPPPRPSHSIPPPLEDGSNATGPRTPNNAREAFAATVGSVPPGAAQPLGTAPTVGSVPPGTNAPKPIPPTPITVPDVRGLAATVDSQKISATVPPPVRGRLPMVLLAVALVAAAGIAIFFATHTEKPTRVAQHEDKDREPKAKKHETPPAAIVDAAVVKPPVDAMMPVPADAANAGAKIDAGTKKHVATPPPPPDEADDNDNSGDSASAEKLRQAEEAVHASQWPRAEQLANSVMNSEDAKPKQKARAVMIHGIVQCLGRNNEEGALTDLRRMKGAFPVLRKRLLAACQKAGFLSGQR
jgi:hypothetical protein